jgi:osmoprotectant transport system permease protein
MKNNKRSGLDRRWAEPLIFLALFVFVLFFFPAVENLLKPLISRKTLYTQRDPLWLLALEHVVLASATSLFSALIAFASAVLLSKDRFASLRALFMSASSIIETFPTVAVMALLIPLTGYGFVPVAIALFFYGLLPVFRNTVEGLLSISPELVDSALGLGMDERQILKKLRLPLAMPLVLQGLRISLLINISAATIGAAVGAGGLGIPIVSGLRSFDPILILQGSLPVACLALFVDSSLRRLEWRLGRRLGSVQNL